MSRNKRGTANPQPNSSAINLSVIDNLAEEPRRTGFFGYIRTHWMGIGASALVLLLCLGVIAKNGWLPSTDTKSGKRTGWFGRDVAKNAPSSWNPFTPPDPTPTPQLSKEYIYAGSRLLAVEDANASAIPPEDLAVWRPSTGIWYVLGGPGSQQQAFPWGATGDVPVQGDYDGDGKTDFAVLRPGSYPANSNWWISPSGGGSYYTVPFGLTNDQPVQADYDGDGKTDIALWRPCITNCYWYIVPSSTGVTTYTQFGIASDVPVPADFDGDGRADVAVWRNSNHTFYSVNTSNGQTVSVQMGSTNDTPVCGDYDGDGKANYAVRHGADWIIMNAALTSTTTTTWQNAGDIAVQNDYDGDGKVDIAVWRTSKSAAWYIKQSHDGSTRTEYWGTLGDIPVPAYYRR